jgi:hypothetical protein
MPRFAQLQQEKQVKQRQLEILIEEQVQCELVLVSLLKCAAEELTVNQNTCRKKVKQEKKMEMIEIM